MTGPNYLGIIRLRVLYWEKAGYESYIEMT